MHWWCWPPPGSFPLQRGLALLGTLASSLHAALAQPDERIPAVIVFATAASGTTIAGVSAAFWALIAGLVVRLVLRLGHRPTA